jgi:hypothetical protein
MTDSIFARYYAPEAFVDRFSHRPDGALDVIIPVLNTNELWEKNLISIYREVPVSRLILGNAGCTDETIATAKKFPRVAVRDHARFRTLGYSIRDLIGAVESEWFIYLHADVYLPDGWFDAMRAHQSSYDWFGCPMRITALIEYLRDERHRPYAGSQMGRKAAFVDGLGRIDDDYVYRQEDFVFADLVENGRFRHGKIEDTFHYHQVMPLLYGGGERVRKLKRIDFSVEWSDAEERHVRETQLRGTVKYLKPTLYQIRAVEENYQALDKLGALDPDEFVSWVARTSPEWLPHIPQGRSKMYRYRALARGSFKAIARRGLEYLLHKLD